MEYEGQVLGVPPSGGSRPWTRRNRQRPQVSRWSTKAKSSASRLPVDPIPGLVETGSGPRFLDGVPSSMAMDFHIGLHAGPSAAATSTSALSTSHAVQRSPLLLLLLLFLLLRLRRYWTIGGALRNVPMGGGSRKSKKTKSSASRLPVDPVPGLAETGSGPRFLDGVRRPNPRRPAFQWIPSLNSPKQAAAPGFSMEVDPVPGLAETGSGPRFHDGVPSSMAMDFHIGLHAPLASGAFSCSNQYINFVDISRSATFSSSSTAAPKAAPHACRGDVALLPGDRSREAVVATSCGSRLCLGRFGGKRQFCSRQFKKLQEVQRKPGDDSRTLEAYSDDRNL
ncbi:Zinc finger protein [Musa troglodytarum]|uniref:Zinc finger protein n=1 Tax=Musa troglodytarum TaxID=320322 RepID=A0A9E7GNZ8_9LILI|nr:Zinc finger protein [Musa troglodytarum]